MSKIYLVSGTIARTDLKFLFSANTCIENAIKSLGYFNKELGEHYDFRIDSIEINDLEEYDAEIIDKFAEELKSRLGDAIHPQDFESMRNLIDDLARQTKEQQYGKKE